MNTVLKLAAIAVAGSVAMAAPASAALTAVQTQSFSFATLAQSTNLAFTGFNAGLGTLQEVIISFLSSVTLNNTAAVVPVGPGTQAVGNPTPLTATATITAAIPAFFFTTAASLTTPGFVGSVLDNNTIQVVGTASNPALGNSSSITNPILLPNYIGGVNLYNINVAASGTQGGSVPSTVLTGNNGTAAGTVNVQYRYDNAIRTPEPASMALLGAGMLALGVARRRRRS